MRDMKRHAWRYKFNGFPIYGRWEDGDEGEIVGVVVEPEWQWADLSETEQATVRAEAAAYRADPRGSDLTEDQAFAMALDEFAVACPHLRWTYHEPVWRECEACRVAERLPGRVVTIGGKHMRVTDPPPRYLRIPRPIETTWSPDNTPSPFAPAMSVDEYEWTGQSYRLVNA